MTLEKLQVIIEAQTKQYLEAMQKVEDKTRKTVGKVQSLTAKLKGVFGKVAKTIGVALSVAAIVRFGRECINLGSDLAEVQNVVDVTFGTMNKAIEDFAKTAAEQFGLSELAAKQYTSTLGAMMKSMGITGKTLEDMSIKLAGLAGDMASFYNLDPDVAFEKIRAGISGETEPLKQLGINLSVANLEAYALSQGMTKAYNSMTQQEQALLRYNYLLSVTADAQGDFARTSDSWANQVRILQLRFESLKATIGQGLINIFTPVLKLLNQLIAKLQVAANAFKRFTELITGKKASSETGAISSSLGTAAGNAGNLTGETEKAGKAAKKVEQAYHGLLGFDEINALTKASDASGSGDAGAGDIGDIGGAADAAAEETDQELNPILQKLIDKLKELRDLFLKGFKAGLGDVTLEPLKKAIEGIKKSLTEIFTDPGVLAAADRFAKTVAYALGQVVGAAVAIGITIATNLVGGLNLYLEQNKDRIKGFLISMFDIGSDIAAMVGNFAQAFANVFSVFGGENGQQVTANLMGIFAGAFGAVLEIAGKAARDILDVFTRPFIDNQEDIKSALDSILEVFVTVTGAIKEALDSYEDTLNAVYDEHIKPFFDSLASGLSDTVGKVIEFWNSNVKPVLDELGAQFSTVVSTHISPMMNKLVELAGTVADGFRALWEGVLKPLIDWIVAYVLPVLLPIAQTIVSTVLTVAGNIADIIGGIIDVIKGIIDFVVGIFTGDWEKAWNGIMEYVSGIMNAIKGVIELVMNTIGGVIQIDLNIISAIFSTIFHAIGSLITTVFNAIKTVITTTIAVIKNGISTGLNTIRTIWDNVWKSLRTTVTTIFNAIWSTIKNTVNSIIGGIEHMANAVVNGVNTVIKALNSLKFKVPDWVPELGGKEFGFDIPTLSQVSLPRLAKGGIVDGATPLIAGEAGREAIVPLERNTGWMDTIANKLGGMIVSSMEAFFDNVDTGGDDYQKITTIVQLNGKTLVEQEDQIRRRMGYRMVPG
nr:MAG TPA: minor tail protein [Caudoviricetes sp.]